MGKSQSSSGNQAYNTINSQMSGYMNNGNAANGMLSNALGIGSDPNAAANAYKAYQDSTGFQNTLNTAMQGVNGQMASKGLLNSGAAAKALQDRATQLGNENYSNWTNQLSGLSGQGINAASALASSGQTSKSSDTTSAWKTGLTLAGGITGGTGNIFF